MRKTVKILFILTLATSFWACKETHTEAELSKVVNAADSLKAITQVYWDTIAKSDQRILENYKGFMVEGAEAGMDPMITQKMQEKITLLNSLTYKTPADIPNPDQIEEDDKQVDIIYKEMFEYLEHYPDTNSRLIIKAVQQGVQSYYENDLIKMSSLFSDASITYNEYILLNKELLEEAEYNTTPIKNFYGIITNEDTVKEEK